MKREPFVPLDKQSKKKRKAYHQMKRGSWGQVVPVTRVMKNKKKPTTGRRGAGKNAACPGRRKNVNRQASDGSHIIQALSAETNRAFDMAVA